MPPGKYHFREPGASKTPRLERKKTAAGTLFKLFGHRWNPARAFVLAQTLDPPHWKELIAEAHERFVVLDRAGPIVKGVEVDPADKDARGVDLAQYTPALFAGSVQNDYDRCAGLDPVSGVDYFCHVVYVFDPISKKPNPTFDDPNYLPLSTVDIQVRGRQKLSESRLCLVED